MRKTYQLEDLDCAVCAEKMEKAISATGIAVFPCIVKNAEHQHTTTNTI